MTLQCHIRKAAGRKVQGRSDQHRPSPWSCCWGFFGFFCLRSCSFSLAFCLCLPVARASREPSAPREVARAEWGPQQPLASLSNPYKPPPSHISNLIKGLYLGSEVLLGERITWKSLEYNEVCTCLLDSGAAHPEPAGWGLPRWQRRQQRRVRNQSGIPRPSYLSLPPSRAWRGETEAERKDTLGLWEKSSGAPEPGLSMQHVERMYILRSTLERTCYFHKGFLSNVRKHLLREGLGSPGVGCGSATETLRGGCSPKHPGLRAPSGAYNQPSWCS